LKAQSELPDNHIIELVPREFHIGLEPISNQAIGVKYTEVLNEAAKELIHVS
jgi:hypothetical protein